MYNIEFYKSSSGKSELWDFLEDLRQKSQTSKDARIHYKQILFYIELLSNNGLNLNENITRHLVNDIWELRPGNNRILYFFVKDNTFVLLHHFIKKSQKIPCREIEKAKLERNDYLLRKEENNL